MESEFIESLRHPRVYPHPTGGEEVEIIQTHLSVVALAGEFAYKLKKAIRLPFADFSTVEERKFFCEEELRLNRRLCPSIYLEVSPLCRGEDGTLNFRGNGETVDYAVKMQRLPAGQMLDVLLAEDRVSHASIREIARRVCGFHAEADRGPRIDALGNPEKLREFALDNFEESRESVGLVFSPELHDALARKTAEDFERHLPALSRRREEGRIVDGHGDLHARNICLTDPVAIYDCIEFEPAFRCGDVATEHAFLIMDLRFRGHGDLAEEYLRQVVEVTGDAEMELLMPTLARYRAMVRAKVSAIAAGEEELGVEARTDASDTAARYLRLAAMLAVEEEEPAWLAMCGLPGTGKSSLAEELSQVGGWTVLSTDRIRKDLVGVGDTERLPESCYTPEFSRRTYAELFSRAEKASADSRVVVLDANFRGKEDRALARRAAADAGKCFVLAEITAEEDEIRRRLRSRARKDDQASDADWEVYRKLKESFESVAENEADLTLRILSDRSVGREADHLLARWLGP